MRINPQVINQKNPIVNFNDGVFIKKAIINGKENKNTIILGRWPIS